MAVQSKLKYGLLALMVSASLVGCGLDGDDGEIGPTGAQGPQGDGGADGKDGANGSDGNDAKNGVSLSIVGRAVLNSNLAAGAEIVQYHAATKTIYATNTTANAISVISASSLTAETPELANPISSANLNVGSSIVMPAEVAGVQLGGINSVAVHGDLMAVAIAAKAQAANGFVLFYNGLNDSNPVFLDEVEVGNLPDMVTFTPDGGKVIVANEGEPNGDYSSDPEGSLSVINILANGENEENADSVTFTAFNNMQAELEAKGMLFPNPSGRTINGHAITTTVAMDLEPEYITATNTTAYVTLQENNGIAVLNLEDLSVEIKGLGYKDWAGLYFDGQEDGAVSFGKYDGLYGIYMPDSIAHYEWKDATFLLTANEGDAREYFFDVADEAACTAAGGEDYDADDGCLAYTDEIKLKKLTAAAGSKLEMLQANGALDDLKVSNVVGDSNGDGEFEAAYTYGARSFTIWDQNGLVVFDSGDDFERITASVHGDMFNNTDDKNKGDDRSGNKGPEPEAITVGVVGSRTYAFIGLERMGGVFVYDITNPYDAFFADYVYNRDLTDGLKHPDAVIGDLAPESLVFVAAKDSPTGKALLVVGNEVSGSVSVWNINQL